jgi:rare lipoprotein A
MDRTRPVATLCALLLLAACGGNRSSVRRDAPAATPGPGPCDSHGHVSTQLPRGQREGYASWYGQRHQGRLTASGERFDMNRLTAAHRTLRFGTRVRVTNLANGRSVEVCINDRGPYSRHRILDLSWAAAVEIGIVEAGTGRVRLEIVKS